MSNGRPWRSDDTQQLRRLAKAGMTDLQIAEAMERDPKLIWLKRQDHSIPCGMPRAMRDMLARINMRRRRRPLVNTG